MVTFYTAIDGINCKTRRAEFAKWLVLLHVAGGISSTDVAVARIHALVAHAGEVGGTTLVPEADLHRGRAIFEAQAHGLVVHRDAGLARGAEVALFAGTLAFVVDAGEVRAAVSGSVTFNVVSCTHKLAG